MRIRAMKARRRAVVISLPEFGLPAIIAILRCDNREAVE
jgi:hypothetical protein